MSWQGTEQTTVADCGEEAEEEGERMRGRDLELPRPDHQVRGEGVWPGADTQVSK